MYFKACDRTHADDTPNKCHNTHYRWLATRTTQRQTGPWECEQLKEDPSLDTSPGSLHSATQLNVDEKVQNAQRSTLPIDAQPLLLAPLRLNDH
jgi:hypothetical protein